MGGRRLSFGPVLAAALALSAFGGGCSQEGSRSTAAPVKDSTPAPPPDATSAASVVGKAPAAKSGMPSIIVLEPKGEASFPPQPALPVMDQISMTFIPATLIVRTGQPAEFRNSDDVLHNVRVREEATKEPAFNVAIPTGQVYSYTFKRPGFYDVGCDIHPGMSAIVVATTSPYAVLADVEGNFAIPDVAPGVYTATVYAGAEKIERSVEVNNGRTQISF